MGTRGKTSLLPIYNSWQLLNLKDGNPRSQPDILSLRCFSELTLSHRISNQSYQSKEQANMENVNLLDKKLYAI
jgi:hypothetical protein